MLKRPRSRAAAVAAGLLIIPAFASCGTQPTTSTDSTAPEKAAPATAADTAEAICAALALLPQIRGEDDKVDVVRQGQATVDQVNKWLSERATGDGPSISLANYTDLVITDPTAPLTVCLFETATPRDIPVPDHITTVANGIRVLAVGPKIFAIDAIGDVNRLSGQLDTLLREG